MRKLRSEILLPAPRPGVFHFFADARNLDRITPSFLRFRVLTPGPIPMHTGTRIDYALRIRGLPFRWTSEITAWEPPGRFVDRQICGPYRWWQHEHMFLERGGSTLVVDDVEYLAPGGRLVHSLFISRDLQRIFDYRRTVLTALFTETGTPTPNRA